MDTFKGTRTLSKTKYYEIENQLQKELENEQVEKVMSVIRNVLMFDPTVSVYNENMKTKIDERRARLKTEGVSTYVSSGAKAHYDKKIAFRKSRS